MTPTEKQDLWNAILKLNNQPYIGSGYDAYNNVKNPALRGGRYYWKYRDMRELYEQLVKYCELGESEACWRVLLGYKTKIYPAYLRKIYQSLNCAAGPSLPFVTTSVFPNANIIGSTVGGGNVTNDGGSAITARGVCYSTSPNPTLADSFTVDGTGTGVFTSNIDLLPLDSTYYIRAYATNATGTGYGNQRIITTPPSFVNVGDQNWSTTNLRVSTYRNGDTIPFAANTAQWLVYNTTKTGAWRYYNDDPSTELIYGRYYNSFAMQDPRLLAPDGYHIPTLYEWDVLNNYLLFQTETMGNLKNTSLSVWTAPNTDAINAYQFESVPNGAIDFNGLNNGYNMGGWAYYWIYTQEPTLPIYSYIGYDGSSAPNGGVTNPGQAMCTRIIDNTSLVRGQLFGGGILLENTGTEGITGFYNIGYVAITDISTGDIAWGSNGVIIGATDPQDGYANTQIMAANLSNAISQQVTTPTFFFNGYNDWYIPAIDEIFQYIMQVPEFTALLDQSRIYATSTELDDTKIRSIYYDGSAWQMGSSSKIDLLPFLAIRKQIL